jgi:hypothetical protein
MAGTKIKLFRRLKRILMLNIYSVSVCLHDFYFQQSKQQDKQEDNEK